jgi:hypothetical protein
MDHSLDGFFKFGPGKQENPAAFQTFDPEIHTGTDDFPQVTAAGVSLPGLDNVSNKIFRQLKTPPRDPFQRLRRQKPEPLDFNDWLKKPRIPCKP